MKFGEAFAEARKSGKKEFEWNGKMYHTRTKEEEAKSKPAPKAEAPKPAPKAAPPAPKVNPQTSKVGERYAASAKAGKIPGRRGSPSRNVPVAPPKAKGGGRSAAAKNRTPAAPAPKKPVRRRTRNR